jgi:hypothetical protein
MMGKPQDVVADADMLAKRQQTARWVCAPRRHRHHGEFRKVIEGINKTLDEVTEPLKAASQSATAVAPLEELMAVSHQMAGNARDRHAGQRSFGGQRAGFQERLFGGFGFRADAGFHPRDRQARQRTARVARTRSTWRIPQ